MIMYDCLNLESVGFMHFAIFLWNTLLQPEPRFRNSGISHSENVHFQRLNGI